MKLILFVILFAAVLLKLGVNARSIIIAFVAAFAVMVALGMLMAFVKLLPVLIIIAVGIYFYKQYR